MLKRTVTGTIILLLTALFITLRVVSEYFFDAFCLIIIYLSAYEILRANKAGEKKTFSALVYIYPLPLAAIYIFSSSILMTLALQLALIILSFIVLMIKELICNAIKRRREGEITTTSDKLLDETKNTLSALIYPITLLGSLMGLNHLGLNIGFVAIIAVFAVTMTTDVFAFIFGMLIKGPKMAPEISPNKTISGMICGALGGIIAAAICYILFVHVGLFNNCLEAAGLARQISAFALIGVLGTFITQFGDLVESAYKRKVGVKDFGSILPGHGGVMDRVDGLMFTSYLVYVVFILLIV